MTGRSNKSPEAGRLLWIGLLIALALVGVFAVNRQVAVNDSAAKPNAPGPTGPRWPNSIGMDFVRIPSGTFLMGSNSSEAGTHEKPAHMVNVSRPFYMATTEVTQAQWKAVMAGNPSRFHGDDLPVERVSWSEAREFIRRLNAWEGTTLYRLPTEAEWEYACRAGTSGPWYGGLDSIAWYESNGGGRTHPVSLKHVNAWGLYDMLGNVYEWCGDWKGEYLGEDLKDPRGPREGTFRVVRGGSWLVHDNRVRSYFRDFLTPDELRDDVGFRVVAVAPASVVSDQGR